MIETVFCTNHNHNMSNGFRYPQRPHKPHFLRADCIHPHNTSPRVRDMMNADLAKAVFSGRLDVFKIL